VHACVLCACVQPHTSLTGRLHCRALANEKVASFAIPGRGSALSGNTETRVPIEGAGSQPGAGLLSRKDGITMGWAIIRSAILRNYSGRGSPPQEGMSRISAPPRSRRRGLTRDISPRSDNRARSDRDR